MVPQTALRMKMRPCRPSAEKVRKSTVIFIPFLVIDLVVSSVLMSMGMFMLPPTLVSLPFKILLFVLVDGWALVVHSLIASFH